MRRTDDTEAGKDNQPTRVSTFDSDALAGPLLLKRGEAFPLADADDVFFEVELLRVETQEAQPQLPHRLRVWLQHRETPTLRGQNKAH